MTKNEALEVARGITGECSCDVAYTSRKLVAPDCIFHECAEDIAQALLDAVQSEREAIVKICEANLTILPQHDAKRGSFNICEGVPTGFDNRAVLTILPQHDAKRGSFNICEGVPGGFDNRAVNNAYKDVRYTADAPLGGFREIFATNQIISAIRQREEKSK